MDVHSIQITLPDPQTSRVRLQARVAYDRHSRDETYWLEVPGAIAHQLSQNGNPWLVAMLPIAATFGEPLRIDAPVDATLLLGARQILRIWNSWDMGLYNADLHVQTDSIDPASTPPPLFDEHLRGAFFSAGVDAFFTVLHLIEQGSALDELIYIEGFDRHTDDTKALQTIRHNVSQAAAELNLPVHLVSTNLRQTLWGDTSWSFVAHGCAAAFVALALEPRFKQMHLAGSVDSVDYDTDMPWGSHPKVDPLFSSSRLAFINHGAETGRFEKIRWIASHPVVQAHLNICFESDDGRNCGRCKKCLIAIAMLDVLGLLDQVTCFDPDPSYLDKLQRLRVGDPGDIGQLSELQRAAEIARRTELAGAAGKVVAHSRRPWHRVHYEARRRLMLWAPHIRDRLRRLHLKPSTGQPK